MMAARKTCRQQTPETACFRTHPTRQLPRRLAFFKLIFAPSKCWVYPFKNDRVKLPGVWLVRVPFLPILVCIVHFDWFLFYLSAFSRAPTFTLLYSTDLDGELIWNRDLNLAWKQVKCVLACWIRVVGTPIEITIQKWAFCALLIVMWRCLRGRGAKVSKSA